MLINFMLQNDESKQEVSSVTRWIDYVFTLQYLVIYNNEILTNSKTYFSNKVQKFANH